MEEKKLAKDELIGLNVTVKECKDPSWTGKTGRIVDETKNTFNNMAEEERKHQLILEDQFYSMSNKGKIIWGD